MILFTLIALVIAFIIQVRTIYYPTSRQSEVNTSAVIGVPLGLAILVLLIATPAVGPENEGWSLTGAALAYLVGSLYFMLLSSSVLDEPDD